ncbi:hypothetical protein L1276_001022 [Flavobacterium sp. HSC-32F16]|uniref:DUF6882 domain-containing protein n=1 Tax=Flavobacterium sp. HSC-32F16 TaxID=2910964 RepID=UPI0020A41AE0|nr:DUF6882 domain-containing protein [Flavobacterium sp. HSC-32F16]MCP2025882.1 hypothetical protein [Flavobacterium sp. HSC-32F16]
MNDFLEKFGAYTLDKQHNLYNVIGENSWNVDLNKQEIYFGDTLTFPIQVLGSFSHSSETWLWIWENKSGYSESLMEQALALKKYGEENNIDLLKTGQFDAYQSDLHLFGMLASEVFNSSAYYLANYGQGTMVLTIKSDLIDNQESYDNIRVSTVFPEFISLFEINNHKNALVNYLLLKGYKLFENKNELIAEKNEKKITATFNENNLLTGLKG